MAKFYDSINDHHREFIANQHMFFVATAPLNPEGHVNVSPKGLDSFRVLSGSRVGYMDVVSSGNETSAHTMENGRITIMMCSFDKTPNILRLYGTGHTVLPDTDEWKELSPLFNILPSTRQLIIADIHKVQTSCGFGVPMFDYIGERDQHYRWAEEKGAEGLIEYRNKNNLTSLDGLETPLGLRENQG